MFSEIPRCVRMAVTLKVYLKVKLSFRISLFCDGGHSEGHLKGENECAGRKEKGCGLTEISSF